MQDISESFKKAIEFAGLTPPESIIADGLIHRFSSNGKSNDNSGWYVLYADEFAAGSFGCWRMGMTQSWCEKSENTMTQTELVANRERVKLMQQQRDLDVKSRQDEAALEAASRWTVAKACTSPHPYLTNKGVNSHGAKIEGDNLLIPMRDTSGTLHSLQTITPDGTKRFLTGGKIKGCYFAIGKPSGQLVVCEGFATGASIHEATGSAVAVAFNAGNLEPVAQALRSKYAAMNIMIGADDDWKTEGNPGLTKAKAAAQSVGGYLATPMFSGVRQDKDTDFNDLHKSESLNSVQTCFDQAQQTIIALATKFATGGLNQWPDPIPLIAQLEPLEYPLDALPDTVRHAVEEVAGFVQAPIPLIAQSALVALSLSIQAFTDVERANRLSGPCSLSMLAIAESGERKTSCDGYFTSVIREYEAGKCEEFKQQIAAYQTELEAWEAQRSGVKEKIKAHAKEGKNVEDLKEYLHDLDDLKPIEPRVPRLIYGDVTPEALALSLAKKWPSGGVVSNEAGVVFGGHAMGKDSAMRNMGTLNQLWDGRLDPIDRKTTESFSLPVARLTLGLQVQEATLRAFFDNTKSLARGTGFLARFLVSWPTSTQGTRFFREAPTSWPALSAFNSRLSGVLDKPAPIDENGLLQPGMLNLSQQAKEVWIAFHNSIERELSIGGELSEVKDVASKTADNAARIAALFHVFEGNTGSISAEVMESATRIAYWHLTESRRFFNEIAMPVAMSNPIKLDKWLLEYCSSKGVKELTTRQIQQFGPSCLRDQVKLESAIPELTELNRIRMIVDGKKKLVQVNPALLEVTEQ